MEAIHDLAADDAVAAVVTTDFPRRPAVASRAMADDIARHGNQESTGRDLTAVGSTHRSRPGTVMLLPRYHHPSDTSDLAWAMPKALLPTPPGQPPRAAPRRNGSGAASSTLSAASQTTGRNGAPPADFGIPWRTVFGYFARWAKAGALKRILDQLRRRLRLRRRRCPQLPRPQRG